VFTLTSRSIIGVPVVMFLAGCNGGTDRSPTTPSNGGLPSGAMVPSGPIPTVTALSVNVGSTDGGTPVTIRGTSLERGATVTFGSTTVGSTSWDPRDAPGTTLLIDAPAHAAGMVDVIVTNPLKQSFRLTAGYEFVPPDSFDFNGEWDGVTTDGSDTVVQFTIRNNVVVSASCRFDLSKTVPLSTAVRNGEFTSSAQDAFVFSGRIVAASAAVGQITGAPCDAPGGTHTWRAFKIAS